jgi:hypothetical protein
MSESLFVPPGTTKDGYIAASDDKPALRFRYRVMPSAATRAINHSLAKLPPTLEAMEKQVKLEVEVLAKHLIDWDAKDKDGQKAAVSEESLSILDDATYMDLRNIMMGLRVSDPEAPEKKD